MRGSTALYAASDFVLAVKRKGSTVEVSNANAVGGKAKDADEMKAPVTLAMDAVDLDPDRWAVDGDPEPSSLAPRLIDASDDNALGHGLPQGQMLAIIGHLRSAGAFTPEKAVSKQEIESAVKGRAGTTRGALDALIRTGRVVVFDGPRRSQRHYLTPET